MKMWYVVLGSVIVHSIACNEQSSSTRERVEVKARVSHDSSGYITRVAEIDRKPNAQATVILCHGFMCSKSDIKFLRWLFPNANTVVFDFRGHGEFSQGQCCTFGYNEAYDVIAVADYVRSDAQLSRLPVIVYGFSMGAAASIHAQTIRPGLFDCAILDCPFDSTDALLRRCIEKLHFTVWGCRIPVPGRKLMQRYVHRPWVQGTLKALLKAVAHIDTSPVATQIIRMSPQRLVASMSTPALFIGCWNDERSPYHAVKSVYRNASGYKRLWMTPGRKHFDSFFHDPDTYATRVQNFVQSYINGTYVMQEQERIISE